MVNVFKKLADFVIRVLIVFTTLMALVFFAGYYPHSSSVFGFLALLFVMALITKSLFDIFSKEE